MNQQNKIQLTPADFQKGVEKFQKEGWTPERLKAAIGQTRLRRVESQREAARQQQAQQPTELHPTAQLKTAGNDVSTALALLNEYYVPDWLIVNLVLVAGIILLNHYNASPLITLVLVFPFILTVFIIGMKSILAFLKVMGFLEIEKLN
jgi:hypothetical protein